MKKNLSSYVLTRQEFQIMKAVWDLGIATVSGVRNHGSLNKSYAYSTVLTFMRILEGKGALVHIRSGRTYVYRPLLSRAQAIQNQVHDLMERVFDGDPVKMIENILENEIATKEQQNAAAKLFCLRPEKRVA